MPVGSPEGRPTPPEGAPSVGRGSRASRPPLAPTLSSMDSFILKQLRGLASSFRSLLDCGGVACCAVIYKQQAGLPEHQHGLDHPL